MFARFTTLDELKSEREQPVGRNNAMILLSRPCLVAEFILDLA
jgi:hypothetical protein